MSQSRLANELKRLLPGQKNTRIRQAIMKAYQQGTGSSVLNNGGHTHEISQINDLQSLLEQFVTHDQLPTIDKYGLVSGGVVQWSGTGLKFNVSAADYWITEFYKAEAGSVTLAPAHATYPRRDGIGLDVNGDIIKITGDPAAEPQDPQFDPETQLGLTYVLVPANATEPGDITTEVFYDENTESATSSTGNGTVDFASANAPYQGAVSVEVSNAENLTKLIFDKGSTLNITSYQTFGFHLKLKEEMQTGHNLQVTLVDDSGNAATNTLFLDIDKSNLNYQFISLQLSEFTVINPNVSRLHITFRRSRGKSVHAGYFIDYMRLQGGVEQPESTGGGVKNFLELEDSPESYTGQAGKYVAVKQTEDGLELVEAPEGGAGSAGLVDLVGFPLLKFDNNYRHSHEMSGPVELEVDTTVPRTFPNHTVLYIKADGTNKPTFKSSDNFSILYDGWNDTVGEWNRFRIEWSPQGIPLVQIMDTSGDENPGTSATDFVLKFDKDYSFSHVIAGPVSLSVDNTGADYTKKTIFYFRADGTNKPTWNSPIEVNWDNYINEAGVWNRFYLEWTPENKVTAQIINT